eukprot:scaffold26_cov173-Pinguiococcus_pyrenoidosus.AAC.5
MQRSSCSCPCRSAILGRALERCSMLGRLNDREDVSRQEGYPRLFPELLRRPRESSCSFV